MTPPPTQIGRYRIIRKLGEGGQGVVYEGANDTIQRRVAIEQFSPGYARDAEATQRLFNEARAVNVIEHPSARSRAPRRDRDARALVLRAGGALRSCNRLLAH